MEFLLKTLLILSLMFGFFYWWPRSRRKADLVQQLTLVLSEIKSGEYDVTAKEDAAVQSLELKNSMARILYERHTAHESLSCNCFFAHKEDSGANVTFVARTTTGDNRGKVTFMRNNTLMGRVLYYQNGKTRGRDVHRLFDEIQSQLATHWAGKKFRDEYAKRNEQS